MPTLRISEDKLPLLRKDLNALEMYGDAAIAEKAKLKQSTVGRLMDGDGVRPQFIYRLLRTMLKIPDGEMSEEHMQGLQAAMAKYGVTETEAVPRGKAPRRADNAAPGRPPLAALVQYSKCLHLRLREEEGKGYAYLKDVPGIAEPVPVYSEFMAVRSLLFHDVQKEMGLEGNSSALVTLQPAYPPRLESSDGRREGVNVFSAVKHSEDEPSAFYQPVIGYLNDFLPGKETVRLRVSHGCDRAVLIADFGSLPAGLLNELFEGDPVALYSRKSGDETLKLKMDCRRSRGGVFVVDSSRKGKETSTVAAWNPAGETIGAWEPETHTLRAFGKIEIHFAVNWQAVRDAYPNA